MVEETIKTIREAEKEAGELVKKADETCTEILENAAAEAKTIKETAKESATKKAEAQLDEAICEYLSSGCCDYDFLEDVLLDLPLSREVAVALYRLTESFDGMLELYEVIFDKYTDFLTDSELSHLLDRAKKVWEPIIWKRWEA